MPDPFFILIPAVFIGVGAELWWEWSQKVSAIARRDVAARARERDRL